MPGRFKNHTWTIRTISPLSESWDLTDLREIEHQSTIDLQAHVSTNGRVEQSGTYVTADWISLMDLSYHLCLEVRIADESTAQVVLCYASTMATTSRPSSGESPSPNTHFVNSFSFCLVQGERKIYELILRFLETTKGCLVAKTGFRPGSMHLAQTLLDTINFMDDRTSGQVDITFGMPRHIHNLDEFSISIPRTCFERLLVDFEYNRPEERIAIPGRHDDCAIPLLKAIRLFILQVMHLDVETLPIIRVANSIVALGVSGKIKMLSGVNIHHILMLVKNMVSTSQFKQASQTLGKRKRTEDSLNGDEFENVDADQLKDIARQDLALGSLHGATKNGLAQDHSYEDRKLVTLEDLSESGYLLDAINIVAI